MTTPPLPGDGEALWQVARLLERAGRYGEAAQVIASLPVERPSNDDPRGASFNLRFVERIAVNLSLSGQVEDALRLLAAMKGLLQRWRDPFGELAVGLQLVELALGAGDLDSAGLFLGELRDNEGALEGADVDGVTAAEMTMLRARALFTHGRYWAAIGRYDPAIAAIASARDHFAEVGGQGISRFAHGLRREATVFLVELHSDKGGAVEAERLLAEAVVDPKGGHDDRWPILRARVAILAGRFSAARRIAEESLADDRAPAHRRAHVVGLTVSTLVLLNRTLEAERLLDRTSAALGLEVATEPHLLAWKGRFKRLLEVIKRRRAGAAADWMPPTLPDDPQEPRVMPRPLADEGLDEPTSSFAPRGVERFFQRWATKANDVLMALGDGDFERAAQNLEQLSLLSHGTDSLRIAARTRFLKGLGALAMGRAAASVEDLSAAADEAAAQDLVADEWPAREALAAAFSASGRGSEAVGESVRAQVLLRRIMGELEGDDATFFIMNKHTPRDHYIRARATALVRTLNEMPAAGASFLGPWRRSRAALSLLTEVEHLTGWELERQLSKEGAGEGSPMAATVPDDEVAPQGGVADVERWVATQLRMEASSSKAPRRSVSRAWPFPMHPKTAVIQFYSLPQTLLVWVVTSLSVRFYEVPLSRLDLRDVVQEALEEILAERDEPSPGTHAGRTGDRLQRLAATLRLEDWLGPVSDGRIDRLVIVPHDTLCHVPFAALPLRGRRMCARFSITFVPHSRSLRLRCAGRVGRYRGRVAAVAVGANEADGLDELPFAFEEAMGVLGALGQEGRPLCDEEVTRSEVERLLASTRWLHVVCHGEVPPGAPHDAALVLYRGERLRISDLPPSAPAAPRGVVLAGCRIGSARALPGNEIVSLPAALLRHGAGGVVAALWGIEDEPASRFMVATYRAARRVSYARALSATQAEFASAGEPAHVWAPYVAYGEL